MSAAHDIADTDIGGRLVLYCRACGFVSYDDESPMKHKMREGLEAPCRFAAAPPEGKAILPLVADEEMVQAMCGVSCKDCHNDCSHGPYAEEYAAAVQTALRRG